MECFSGFWVRRSEEDQANLPWYIRGIEYTKISPPQHLTEAHEEYPEIHAFSSNINLPFYSFLPPDTTESMESQNDFEMMKTKAEKHSEFYRTLYEESDHEMLTDAEGSAQLCRDEAKKSNNILQHKDRQRRTGVYEMDSDGTIFKSVKHMKVKYQEMLNQTSKQLLQNTVAIGSEKLTRSNSIDGYLVPPPSGYCSSGTSDDERDRNWKHQTVHRCGSSDSAVGQSDDEVLNHVPCFECDKELYYETVQNPYSPRGSVDHENVPSKTIIEAQYVPFPEDHKLSDCVSESGDCDKSDSRRQSCFTDDGDETRCRYWRTPSVVVSDYSDDIIGLLTLDDIEYFRSHRKECSSPDSSVHSSCSNLNYCGSTISCLDSDYTRHPYRKSSDCSTCSTYSGDEDGEPETSHSKIKPSGWRKLRNIVQWTPFFQTYKKQRYPWVQLAGHQGNFKAGPDQGTILKKLCEKEEKCFKILMKDILRPYVPEYKGLVTSDDGECSYLQLQDLLGDFQSPCVMDCKIGVRTYLEEELAKAKEKPKLRKDMYEKMCQIDSNAPTEEEHRLKGVTKPRYMIWRETISSTETLGFRIEGIRKSDGTSSKDFKTTKTKDNVMKAFMDFTEGFPHAIPKYIQRLKAIKVTLEASSFFSSHEVIGSSLLFVHDKTNANVWLIDFAKTISLPSNVQISHGAKWKVGNHEDGYLIGINNIVSIFIAVMEQQPVIATSPLILSMDKNEDEAD